MQFPGGNGVAKKDVKSGTSASNGDSRHTIFPFVDKVCGAHFRSISSDYVEGLEGICCRFYLQRTRLSHHQ